VKFESVCVTVDLLISWFPTRSAVLADGVEGAGGWASQVAAQKSVTDAAFLSPSKEPDASGADDASGDVAVVRFKVGIAHPQGMTRLEVHAGNAALSLCSAPR